MGTLVRIIVYAHDPPQARKAMKAAFARVSELDSILSDYNPESELNLLCDARSMIVSEDLFRVLEASQRLAQETDGAFDITVGPLVRLWRQARLAKMLPDPSEIEKARTHTGWRMLTLDRRTRKATLAATGLQLDVGGIAKGYAADEAIRVLKMHGIRRALVAAGGDIAVSGPPPNKQAWDLTVELAGGTRDIHLRNAAVSTAGDTEQFVQIEGIRYSHILDPKQGLGLTHRIAVSVIAPTGLEADGLDTAISVLGMRGGLDLMKRHPKAKALIISDADGTRETPGFGR